MKKLFLIKQYFIYLLKRKSAHGVHSPFVFEFVHEVLQDDRHYYAFDEIEKLRLVMYANEKLLEIEDFGAGSHKQNNTKRKVKDIAKTAGRNAKYGALLFRIVQKYRPMSVVELGTSMGLGTAYLAMANKDAVVTTIEGSKEIAAQAGRHFAQWGLQNVKQYIGNFDEVLSGILKEMKKVDILFVDGNHRKEPTIRYFEMAKPFLQESSVVIFDDIHWSPEMHAAWQIIKRDSRVTLSIDLFYFGIVFFKKEFKEKQDFVLKY